MAAVTSPAAPGSTLSSVGPATLPTQKDLIVSVVVPVHNQAARVPAFVDRVQRVLEACFPNHELILADDSSSDGTIEVVRALAARNPNLRLLVLSRHYGAEIALTAGLDAAVGDFVVTMPPHLEDPPELIPQLVRRAQDGFDVVYVRKPPLRSEPWPYRLAIRAFYRLCRWATGLDMHEDSTGYQVLSRRVVNSLGRLKEHNRVNRMLSAYVGFTTASIDPAGYADIYQGRAGLHERYHVALDAIVAFSDKPLRYASGLSLALAGLALLGALTVVAGRLLGDTAVPGWTSLMVVQLGMFCLLFFVLAIVAEYVSRILIETKNRPLYYVREETGGTRLHIENMVDID
jgi:dolichol-phosphate mannosyltransferase